MAKKNDRLISKKTKKKIKAVAPWAIAIAATTGMVAAVADRALRGRVKMLAAETVAKVRPSKRGARQSNGMSNGMVNGIVPQESGAV